MASIDLRDVFGVHQGRVTSFDDQVGAGTVLDDAGSRWSFHCTSIADGSRTIAAGTTVTFRVVAGPVGFEAADVSSATSG